MYFWLILVLIFLIMVYLFYQNNRLKISTYKLTIPRMDTRMKGKRIVFFSDTHFRERTPHTFIDRLVIQIEEINPDLILFGGDIIHVTDNELALEYTKDLFAQLEVIAPTYVIYGNHDMKSERLQDLSGVLKRAGVTLLENKAEWLSLGEPGAGFWLMGLSDYASSIAIREEPLSTIKLPEDSKNEPKILLAHFPHFFDKYLKNDKKRPDLVLAGHTHGGQAIVPLLGGLFSPGQGFNPKYDFGLFTNEKYPNSRLIVTRGVGNSTFPFRINNRPEIVVIEFE